MGWDYYTRLGLERVLEAWRVVIVVAAVAFHLFYFAPPVSLTPNNYLGLGDSIGVCQSFNFPSCTPYKMTLHPTGKSLLLYLAVIINICYLTDGPNFVLASYQTNKAIEASMHPVWKRELEVSSAVDDAEVALRISANGILRLVATKDKREVVVWSSPDACTGSGGATLRLDRSSGEPLIHCGDGSLMSF